MTPAGDANHVDVTFTVTFDFERYYTEGELTSLAADLNPRIQGASTIEGSIDIAAPDAPVTRIVDELAPWIQNLCFRAVLDLAADNPVRVQYFSRSGYLDLTPRGELVELSGDKNPPAAYPRQTLMSALVDCGERFLAFAQTIKGNDETYMANLNYVRGFEAASRAALAQE